jgi:predicted RNA-binding protein YlxR (DUF448 family)
VAAPGRLRRPPTRTCVVCRTPRDKRDLLRVVRMPSGGIALDPGGRADGRGAYLCRTGSCIDDAFRRGALGRALAVTVPPELHEALAAAATTLINDDRGGPHGKE